MMVNYFYPICHYFLTNHNGACIDYYWANWGLGSVAGVMATAILCDDRVMYDTAMYYYKYGLGNEAIGNMVYYVYSDDFGQWQESGRDQAHSLMGIGLASSICEMAWKQGEDLYVHGNHRLYKGINYMARYNLGYDDVPYTTYDNCSLGSPQTVIGSGGRGEVRPIWELIYNHYKTVLGGMFPIFNSGLKIYVLKGAPANTTLIVEVMTKWGLEP